MCLDYLREFPDTELKKKNDCVVAYKVVTYLDIEDKFIPYHVYGPSSHLKSLKWYKASDRRLKRRIKNKIFQKERTHLKTSRFGQSYEVGFHCLLTLEDAIAYTYRLYKTRSYQTKIIKVYVKNIVAMGMQAECQCLVAKNMYIPNQEVKTRDGKRCRGLKI
jgi:hypothetical protein